MAPLSQDRVGVVRTLIEAAPDSAVQSLELALRGEHAGGSLSSVKTIVIEELNDRLVRDAVFEPLVPLFVARSDGFDQIRFPKPALTQLWRALKQERPDEAAAAAALRARRFDGDELPPIYDELCVLAARGLRAERGPFASLAALVRDFRAGADADLIACLDLAPISRRALRHLPSWISRMTEEKQATARLTFKDATAVAEDAGPRLVEILFAHLAEPWAILRVISAMMLKPGDRYASSSELADFGARLLRDVDRRALEIKGLDYIGGAEGGRQAAESLRIAGAVAAEFEHFLSMNREGPWGERVAKQKQALASAAESHLKKVDKAIVEALPTQPIRVSGRIIGETPRLETPPDPVAVRRAMALLSFFAGIRTLAAQNGYGTMRARVQEEAAHRLEIYLEELLEVLHAGEGEYLDNARLFLETAADFTGLAHDDQAAQIVRRRAAAA